MKKEKKVTFATSCWERDWEMILKDPHYLARKQIENHCYPFFEKLLIINNVKNLNQVVEWAQRRVNERVLSRYVIAEDVLSFFGLHRSNFDEWQYYNALGPLNAIFEAQGDYLLFCTGDVYLKKPARWIDQAIRAMQKNESLKVANLTWNENYAQAKKESYRTTWNFYISNRGFSDQMFLVKRDDFMAPIYSAIREDADHFPRGDVLEKRIFSHMINSGWKRITYKRGSYIHQEHH